MAKSLINISKSILVENSTFNNLTTDIGLLKYVTQDHVLKGGDSILKKRFCDNFILINIFDKTNCESKKDLKEFKNGSWSIKIDYVKKINADFCSVFNKDLGYDLHGKITCKSPLIFQELFYDNLRFEEKELIQNYIKIHKIDFPVYSFIKVSVEDYDYKKVLEDLILQKDKLMTLGFFLHDFDLTEDLTGIFFKEDVITYLLKKGNFYLQKKSNIDSYKNNVILDKDSTSGINCLIIIHGNLKIKLYNKFICQITNPGTDSSFGSMIYPYINPKKSNVYLSELFKNKTFIDKGCTRLEITFYVLNTQINFCNTGFKNYKLNTLPYYDIFKKNDVDYIWDKYLSLIRRDDFPLYEVPISSMWSTITKSLKNNCCIYFPKEKQFFISLFVNKLTSKVTGWNIESKTYSSNDEEDIINYVKSNYSLNCLPFYFITINDKNKPEDYLLTTYIKEGSTYLTKFKYLFTTYKHDLSERGIVETYNLIPKLYTENQNARYTNNLQTLTILETKNKVMFYNNVNNKTREENYRIQQEIDSIDISIQREEYKNILKIKNESRISIERIVNYLKNSFDDYYTSDIIIKKQYNIIGFSVSKKLRYERILFIAKDKDDMFMNYKFTASGKIKKNIHDLISNIKLSKIERRDYDIYYIVGDDYGLNTILSFKATEKVFNPDYKSPYFLYEIIELKNKNLNNNLDKKIESVFDNDIIVSNKDLISLDTLDNNSTYNVLKLKDYNYRNIRKWIILLEGYSDFFKSNSYFENEMENKVIETKFSFKTVEMKRFDYNKNKKELSLKFLL